MHHTEVLNSYVTSSSYICFSELLVLVWATSVAQISKGIHLLVNCHRVLPGC